MPRRDLRLVMEQLFRGRPSVIVLLLFTILTVIYTYPYAFNLGTMVNDPVDPLLSTWTMLWDRHILLDGPAAWSRLFDANIFFPYRATLAFSEHLLGNMALALPLLTTHPSPLFALNVIVLLTFVLSGFGTWLLVTYWTGDRWAAFLAGVIFAFNSTRLIVLGQLNLIGVQWMPLTLLALHLYLDKGKWQRWLLGLIFLNLQLLSAINYTMHIALLVSIFVSGYWLVHHRRLRLRPLVVLSALALITLLINSPIWSTYWRTGQLLGIERDLGAVRYFSAGLSDYLLVTNHSPWRGLWTPPASPANKLPAPLFPGVVAVLLGLIGGSVIAIRPPRRGRWFPSIIPILWVLATVGFVLSLGANEQALGPGLAPTLQVILPYPWLWAHVPGLKGFRAPARFAILFFLALSLLSGLTLAALARTLAPSRWQLRSALTVVLVAFPVFEYFAIPLTGSFYPYGADIPSVYGWLRQTEADAVVQEFPFFAGLQMGGREMERMYYSHQNWRQLVNGSSGYNPLSVLNLGYVMGPFPNWRSIEAMQRIGVNYALLHPSDYDLKFGAGAWLDVWARVPTHLPDFSHVWQVGDDYVLQLDSPTCAAMLSDISVSLILGEAEGDSRPVIITFANPTPAAFVSDPNRPSRLTARWWQAGRIVQETDMDLHEPLLVLPTETTSVMVSLSQPAESDPDELELVASLDSLERQIGRDFDLSIESEQESPSARITVVPAEARLPEPVQFEGGGRLLGYSLVVDEVTACQSLPVILYWEVPLTETGHEWVSVGLINRFGRMEIEDRIQPWLGRVAGHVIADERALPIPGPLPAGQYTLAVRLQKPDDAPLPAHTPDGPAERLPLASVLVRPGSPDLDADGWQPVGASVADVVTLVAYRLDRTQLAPGDWLRLTLVWQARAVPGRDVTVFTQLIGPDGRVWGQYDNPPRGGWYPTSLWQPGELVADDYLLQVSPEASPDRYTLVAGMYLPDTLERLPVRPADGGPATDVIVLTEIEIGGRE